MSSQALQTRTNPGLDVFARLLRAHASVTRALETRLLAEHALTINDYETLLHLSREPEGRLRRVDLAKRLVLTPSGVTRLLDGLQAAGYVEKGICESDARVTYAVLTPDGARKLEEAAACHIESVRELFGEHLDDEALTQLSELLGRLPGVGDYDGETCLPE